MPGSPNAHREGRPVARSARALGAQIKKPARLLQRALTELTSPMDRSLERLRAVAVVLGAAKLHLCIQRCLEEGERRGHRGGARGARAQKRKLLGLVRNRTVRDTIAPDRHRSRVSAAITFSPIFQHRPPFKWPHD